MKAGKVLVALLTACLMDPGNSPGEDSSQHRMEPLLPAELFSMVFTVCLEQFSQQTWLLQPNPANALSQKSYRLTGDFSGGRYSESKTRMSVEGEALARCPVHSGHRLYLEPVLIREASCLSPQGHLNTLLTLFPTLLCSSLLIYRL